MYKTIYLSEPVQMNEKEYLWYKLCVFYHAQTEIFDRGLTDLRSPHDPTEAYIVGEIRMHSNMYALNMRQFIREIARKLDSSGRNLNDFNYLRYSAQHWIDEYYRLKEKGEYDFICRN